MFFVLLLCIVIHTHSSLSSSTRKLRLKRFEIFVMLENLSCSQNKQNLPILHPKGLSIDDFLVDIKRTSHVFQFFSFNSFRPPESIPYF